MRWSPIPRQRKKRRIRQQLRCLPPHAVKLFEDETDLLLFPPLRAAWGRRGQPLEVRLSGGNARRVVFGVINIDTGRRLFSVRGRQRSEDFCAFLPLVAHHYRGRRVALVLDEDPSHTAQPSRALATELGIMLIWLPKRCPELNGMDHLWGHGKDHICADRQYHSIDAQAERFVAYLAGLSNQDALRQAGLLSPDFWLKL
jgi:transposase